MSMETLEKIAFWTVVVATVIGAILTFVYPHKPQSESVFGQWQADHGAIVVIIQADTEDEAKNEFERQYPDYTIVEIMRGKKGWYIKAVRKDGD
ncbi:MAG: hypothetical protein J7L34_07325 [Thermotogaceae bacterium]|nr:hypothetical protein [Thermotogaceae bacterium]